MFQYVVGLFLVCGLFNDILTMDNPLFLDEKEALSIEARELHEFCTKNLDDEMEPPAFMTDKVVLAVNSCRSGLPTNPLALEFLKDKRTDCSLLSWEDYLARHKDRRLEVAFSEPSAGKIILKLGRRTSVDTGRCLIPPGSPTYVTIQKDDDQQLINLGREQSITLVDGKSRRYSLLQLLLECKKPHIVQSILNRAQYFPSMPYQMTCKDHTWTWTWTKPALQRKVEETIDPKNPLHHSFVKLFEDIEKLGKTQCRLMDKGYIGDAVCGAIAGATIGAVLCGPATPLVLAVILGAEMGVPAGCFFSLGKLLTKTHPVFETKKNALALLGKTPADIV